MEESYLLIDQKTNKRGNSMMELKELEGKLVIKQFSGFNVDNFIIKKPDGKKLGFSFSNINGIFYINLNGEHMIDYKRFVNIQQISNSGNDLKLKNAFIGDILLQDCDVEIFSKALSIMNKYMKNKKSYYKDLMDFMFTN